MALMKLRAAAAAAGISYDRLWRAVHARQVAAVRFTPRGNYLVQLADVRAWLERHVVDAIDTPPPASRPRPRAAGTPGPIDHLLPPTRERRFA